MAPTVPMNAETKRWNFRTAAPAAIRSTDFLGDGWEIRQLKCARCGQEWDGAWSDEYRKQRPMGGAISCIRCGSRFGVHPRKSPNDQAQTRDDPRVHRTVQHPRKSPNDQAQTPRANDV